MNYLLMKVWINKALIDIKSNIKTLKISQHNGNVGVCLRGGTRFESCPMHVVNILIFYLLNLCVINSDILYLFYLHFSHSVRFTLRHRSGCYPCSLHHLADRLISGSVEPLERVKHPSATSCIRLVLSTTHLLCRQFGMFLYSPSGNNHDHQLSRKRSISDPG